VLGVSEMIMKKNTGFGMDFFAEGRGGKVKLSLSKP